MELGRSNADLLVGEEDTKSDMSIPSRIMMQGDDPKTLQRITGKTSIVDWADETIGDTHIVKRKQKTITNKSKERNLKRVLRSDESTPSLGHKPPYQESNDNTSVTDDDDGGDGASG
jgi:hypothetical protein